jgi:hypothetical protein
MNNFPVGCRYSAQKLRLFWLFQRGPIALVTILTLCLLPFLVHALVKTGTGNTQPADRQPARLARLSETVSVHAAGRGNPTINLSDGHDVLTSYVGPQELRVALEQNQAEPLSLASADFDEDGVPDLVSGYAYNGQGIVTLLRGNVDSIYPNAPEAQRRKANGTFTDAPFLSPSRAFAAPVAADFIGAGDFDGDSHWDVVVGSHTRSSLYLLSGDGHGGFQPAKEIPLPGVVTAMTTGEINRADGLTDIVVGVTGPNGSSVMVFEGPEGALRSQPEVLTTSHTVNSLALDRVDDDPEVDLLIAAGSELILVHGRDRKLSQGEAARAQVSPPTVDSRIVASEIRSVSVGDFRGDGSRQIAMLCKDGRLRSVTAADIASTRETLNRAVGTFVSSRQLVRTRVSGTATDALLVMDPSHIQVVDQAAWGTDRASALQRPGAQNELGVTDGQPMAILPMRLDRDAFKDLVILRNGHCAPTAMMSGTPAAMPAEASAGLEAPGSAYNSAAQASQNLIGMGQPQLLTGFNGKIAFASNRDNGGGTNPPDIYVMNPDGSGQTRLTFGVNGGIDPVVPVWSPDGTKIAFSSFQSNGNYDIYTINANGGGQVNLTNTAVNEFDPAWSNDGSKLAYGRGGDIWVMNANGSQQTLLLTNGSSPSWSPDGTRILFTRNIVGGFDDIFVMNTDGTGVTNLTNNPGGYFSPKWSPDGARVIFATNSGISKMNPDGTGVSVLTNNGSNPEWSPDGSKVAFSRYQNGNPDVFVMNVDGTNVVPLTNNAAYDNYPSWQVSSVPTPTPTPTPIPSPTATPTPAGPPPANDNFANAEVLAPGFIERSNAAATNEPGEPNHAGIQGGASVWFRWQAPGDGSANLYIFPNFDGLLAVYTGTTLSALTPVASSRGSNARVFFSITAGTVYQIAVDGAAGATGNFFLSLDPNLQEADAAMFSVSGNIIIPDSASPPGKATTYPSTINVAGMSGTVTRMTVTLGPLQLDSPNDVDILLVGPQGQNAIIMSDVGGGAALSRSIITLDDFASTSLPANGPITDGTFKPTNVGAGDSFPSPAPAPSGGSPLSAFNGTNPNGAWSLYVVDDNANGKSGYLENGWTITIDTGPVITNSLVVTNTNDSGPGSLRQAMIKANGNPGADTIIFNIGSGPQSIFPFTPLPFITEAVTIDATTQPGFNGTPLIQVDTFDIRTANATVRGFQLFGVTIAGPGGGNIVEGNYISGQSVEIDSSPNNLIGGTTVAARNVISSNSSDFRFAAEIDIGFGSQSVGNQISGNFIGTNVSGTGPPANGEACTYGIQLLGGMGTIIGGTTAGARNIINNGGINNIFILGANAKEPQGGNLIQGNYIGIDVTGSHPLSNKGGGGIWILGNQNQGLSVSGNLVGGTVAAARNVISGNQGSGVGISDTFSTPNLVQGNYIGTDSAGTAAVGNFDGVQLVSQQPGAIIGGSDSGARNLISGNNRNGVSLGRFEGGGGVTIGGTGATIQGNLIGTDVAGTGCVGNANDGIYVEVTTVIHTIKDNIVACNGNNGITIPNISANPGTSGTPAFRINMDGNLVYSNHGLGIDLGTAGVTQNKAGGPFPGEANLHQNFPILTSVTGAAQPDLAKAGGDNHAKAGGDNAGATATVNGTLNSTPNTAFTVHWYFSADAQCVTNQQTSRPLVTGKEPDVRTNGNGDAQFSFSLDLPVGINNGIVNCTATDPQGNTSEFSACLSVNASPPPSPTPTPIQLILDTSGPAADQVAALDSITFLRDPFPVMNGADSTKVIVFVTNLQLAQGETPSAVLVSVIVGSNPGINVAAEDVRPVPNFNFTQVIFKLPNLPVGTCTIKVNAHGQVSNAGTIRIRI